MLTKKVSFYTVGLLALILLIAAGTGQVPLFNAFLQTDMNGGDTNGSHAITNLSKVVASNVTANTSMTLNGNTITVWPGVGSSIAPSNGFGTNTTLYGGTNGATGLSLADTSITNGLAAQSWVTAQNYVTSAVTNALNALAQIIKTNYVPLNTSSVINGTVTANGFIGAGNQITGIVPGGFSTDGTSPGLSYDLTNNAGVFSWAPASAGGGSVSYDTTNITENGNGQLTASTNLATAASIVAATNYANTNALAQVAAMGNAASNYSAALSADTTNFAKGFQWGTTTGSNVASQTATALNLGGGTNLNFGQTGTGTVPGANLGTNAASAVPQSVLMINGNDTYWTNEFNVWVDNLIIGPGGTNNITNNLPGGLSALITNNGAAVTGVSNIAPGVGLTNAVFLPDSSGSGITSTFYSSGSGIFQHYTNAMGISDDYFMAGAAAYDSPFLYNGAGFWDWNVASNIWQIKDANGTAVIAISNVNDTVSVPGNLRLSGGLTVSGGMTVSGGLTVSGSGTTNQTGAGFVGNAAGLTNNFYTNLVNTCQMVNCATGAVTWLITYPAKLVLTNSANNLILTNPATTICTTNTPYGTPQAPEVITIDSFGGGNFQATFQ